MPSLLRRNNMKLLAREYMVSIQFRVEQLQKMRDQALAQNDTAAAGRIEDQIKEVSTQWAESFATES
jgi:hypothetical protein